MAKVKFLHPRKLGKTRYPKGICDVPAQDCKGWFWDAIVMAGDIAPLDDKVKATAVGAVDGKKPASAGGPPKMSDEDKAAKAEAEAAAAKSKK